MSGFGEGGGGAIKTLAKALLRVRPYLEASCFSDPALLWEHLHPQLADNIPVLCALDMAAYDLWGKLRGQPVWKLWGLSLDCLPPTDYTIGIDSLERMLQKMQEFPGWPVYKIKLGTCDDLNIVRELRKHTDAVFRVDANCGWGIDETIRNSYALKDIGVEFIEQPLAPERWDDMKEVFVRSALPVIADESCRSERDVDRCLNRFHGINVKLVKCGGLTPARRMIAQAKQLGLKTMIGCGVESTIGISASAQLLPLLDYADLDGALLLAHDIASGVAIDRGGVRYPDENGCGVRLLADCGHLQASGSAVKKVAGWFRKAWSSVFSPYSIPGRTGESHE
jgi:L-alanine-DL-glutamate epimerase-like enolase superfamily enzyme